MRKNIVVGNWKMNLNINQGINLVQDCLYKLSLEVSTEVVFAPSHVFLYEITKMCNDREYIFTASQDCSTHINGPNTGEVSAEMIASCGARYVILGHSERRKNFNETNEQLKLKVNQVIKNNLKVIFCCGESEDQRNKGIHFEWIKSQITESLFHLTALEFSKITIAYEPIWAIGTGNSASSDQAQEVHEVIRNIIKDKYGYQVSENTSILYGGSCNISNSVKLFSNKDIDGGLIGGASLSVDDFISIVNSF